MSDGQTLHAMYRFCHEIFGPGIHKWSGRTNYVEQMVPPDYLCCHKWSGQNINGPGGQTINSAHSKWQQVLLHLKVYFLDGAAETM